MNATESHKAVPFLNNPATVDDVEVYKFLTAHYLHQNGLSWSRTQALGVIQIGILTAAFSKGGCIAIGTLMIGSILVWMTWCLVQRDWELRDQHLDNILRSVHSPRNIDMRCEPKYQLRKGAFILPFIIYLLLIINVALAVGFWRGYLV
jgi:hypothetical protein